MGQMSSKAKEAAAIGIAVVLVGLALLLGGRAEATTSVSHGRPAISQTVVAVEGSPEEVAKQWRRTPMSGVPGEVLVIPSAATPDCQQEITEAARASHTIHRVATCSATAPAHDASRTETFMRAVERASQTNGTVVLLGEGWDGYVPLPLHTRDFEDPRAFSLALKHSQLAGAMPELDGISVVIAVPNADSSMRRVWKEYTARSGAEYFQWLPA